jgi:hypothetical protein
LDLERQSASFPGRPRLRGSFAARQLAGAGDFAGLGCQRAFFDNDLGFAGIFFR